ncbi:hypothetical protein F4561_004114 [Lipingzhangella halophila]|uniref:CRISPR-associated protein n=1 Tax=Lipingzhangella halophila TaxID=1783352 RepID=A0A7W7RJU4_9ACTN|nr:CRISPR-associated protein [Lipingzhangella halophila]MBB4933294.1 hypothetical protein [Lipingzhangella halophila]
MRADSSPSDAPQTLVALVGTSPTPPLLSALTFAPPRLVLVHSADTLGRAERIAKMARRLCPRIEHTELFDLGRDVYDFRSVDGRFAGLLPTLGGAWRLCYTGGTKVMGIAAVLRHLDLFPEQHHWRSYLDATTDALRFTDGSVHPGGPDSSTLTTTDLAKLHQVDLHPAEPSARPDEGAELEARVLALFRDQLSGIPDSEVIGNQIMPDPGAPEQSIGDFDLIVRYRHRILCVEVKKDPDRIPGAAGWAVTKAKRAFGSATRVLLVHDGEPGACSRFRIADYDPELNGAPLHVRARAELEGEFHTARDLLEGFFLPRHGSTPPDPVQAPVPAQPPGDHPGHNDGPLLLMGVGGSRLGVLAAAHAYRPSQTVLLHTPQSEREVAGLAPAVCHTLFAAENPDEFKALRRRQLPARLRRYRNRVKFGHTAVDASDAARVAALAHAKIDQYASGDTPVVADVTTGTKAMSTGLALAAHARGGCVTYLSPVTRRVSCHAHGPVGSSGVAAVDWSSVLRGYTPLAVPLTGRIHHQLAEEQVDTDLLDSAAAVLREHAGEQGHTPTVWVDGTVLADSAESPLARRSVDQRPTLVVTVADRAVGLTAPCWSRRQRLTPGDWAHAVFAATMRLNAACGVAGLTLALHRPGEGSVRRALDLVDWLAWTETSSEEISGAESQARHGRNPRTATEEITGHEESLRPKVVSATPGTPEFRAALTAHLRGLGV